MNIIERFKFALLLALVRLVRPAFGSVGSVDASFESPAPNNWVRAIAVQPDGKILVGGPFPCCDTFCLGGIIRLLDDLTANNPRLAGQTFTVAAPTIVGKNYTLQYKKFLTDANWTPVLPSVPGDGTVMTLTDPAATNTYRIHRVLEN